MLPAYGSDRSCSAETNLLLGIVSADQKEPMDELFLMILESSSF
jgi:hypothetical protein